MAFDGFTFEPEPCIIICKLAKIQLTRDGREEGIRSMWEFMNKTAWKRAAALAAAAMVLALGMSACKSDGGDQDGLSSMAVSQTDDPSRFPEGATIGGKNIGGKTVAEAQEIAQSALDESMASLEISVKFKDDTISLQGADFDTQNILDLVLPDMLATRRADKFELPFVTDLSEAGRKKLDDAAQQCYAQAKDAEIASFDGNTGEFTFQDEQTGSRVDMAATLRSVRELLAQKHGGAIQAAFVETKPKITKQYLQENFKKLSTYSTTSSNTANGNSNMALALSKVNGTILKPGEVFSYNTITGDSTDPAGGWLPAGALSGGVSVMSYGGGICQGSTTIYNAAMMAGMEVVERDCHSSPSGYCPIGLDATVDYGNIDFKFKNCLENPVYIASWMDGVTLTVNFYGCFPEEWDNIEVGSEQTGSEGPRGVEFREDSSLAKGQYVRKSTGNSGFYASAWRIFYKDGQEVKREDLPSSYYRSTPTVYLVGPGTDTSKVDTSSDSGNMEPTPSPSPTPAPDATPEPVDPTPEPPEPPVDEPTPEPTPEPPIEEDPTPEPSGGDVEPGDGEDGGDVEGEPEG